jgi:hypothetical protein
MAVPSTRHGLLGKKEAVPSPFGEFKTYFDPEVLATLKPPPAAHYGGRVHVPWQMDGNGPDPEVTIMGSNWSGAGDCVEAYKAHGLLNADWDGVPAADKVTAPTANAVVEQYCTYQGCTPAQLLNDPDVYDQGEDMTTSLVQWTKGTEYKCKLGFTAPVNQTAADIQLALWLSGGIGLGIQVQEAQEEQFPNTWQWVPGSPIIGGHAIWVCGYDADVVWLITWGQMIAGTWDFVLNATDEIHASIFSPQLKAGKGPTGLNIAQWEADLHAI